MGGFVDDRSQPTTDGRVGGNSAATRPKSLLETFEEACPIYMAFGMTWHQFWDGSVDAHKAYRKAYDLKRDATNFELWLQGRYVYDAILANVPVLRAFSKARQPNPYNEKPYDLNEARVQAKKEREEQERYARVKEKVAMFAEEFNKQRKEAVVSGNSDGD